MVAAARMRKAQGAIMASRPFAVKMEQTIGELALLESESHPFFKPRTGKNKVLLLVTADKGLCGSFNANVLKTALHWVQKNREHKIFVAVAGRKGREMLHRLRDVEFEFLAELVNVFPKISFAHADMITKPILERWKDSSIASVTMIYNEFKSVMLQKTIERQLLPISMPPEVLEQAKKAIAHSEFHYEPEQKALLKALLPRYIKAQIFRILLESQAAELAARMNAMDAATKNAGDLIDTLTLWSNRARQSMITQELMEIVGGAAALEN